MSGSDEDFDAPSLKRWKDRFEKGKAGVQAKQACRKKSNAYRSKTAKQREDSAGSHTITMHTSHTIKSTGRAKIKEVNMRQRTLSPHKQYCRDTLDARQSQVSNFLLVSSTPDRLVVPDPSRKTDSHHFLSVDSPPNCKVKHVGSLLNGSKDRIESSGFTSTGDKPVESTLLVAIGSAGNQGSVGGLTISELVAEEEGSDSKGLEPYSLDVASDDCESTGIASFYEEQSGVETCASLSNNADSMSYETQEHTKDCYLLRDREHEMAYGTVTVLSDGGTAACSVSELQSKVMITCTDEASCFHGDTEASSSCTKGGMSSENTGSEAETDCENTEFGSAVNGISRHWSSINTASSSASYHSSAVNASQPACTPGPSNWEEPHVGGKAGSGTFLAPAQDKRSAVKRKSLAATAPIPVKRQMTLLSFLSASSKSEVGKDHRKAPSSAATCSNFSLPSYSVAPPNAFAASSPAVPVWKPSSSGSRSCPFYKRVPGTNFSVDAFSYGSIPECSAYFLTHFHSDHYQGITRRFRHPLYCSQVTANLVRQRLKVPSEHVHPLPMNEPCVISGVGVTLVDANHCPGSVMLLFKLPSGRNYLHTGDFRFCQSMMAHPQFAGCPISQLFLDTTYCSPQYDFPSQETVIDFAVQKSLAAVKSNPRTLVVCGTYTIGKEKVFLALAEALGSKVCVSKEKKTVLECLESDSVAKVVTTHPGEASVHVLPISRLNSEDLSVYLEQCPGYTSLLAFRPTGWTHSGKHLSLASIRPKTRGAVTIYGIPYSEHSSFSELRQFVQFLRPQRVIPTVGGQSASKREEMQGCFRSWLSPGASNLRSPSTRQSTLDSTFKIN